jgi:xylose isomerase
MGRQKSYHSICAWTFNAGKGHDMQPRAHDTETQAVDRVIRSILSRDACEYAAERIDYDRLNGFLEERETAKAEDIMRNAVVDAQLYFNRVYRV